MMHVIRTNFQRLISGTRRRFSIQETTIAELVLDGFCRRLNKPFTMFSVMVALSSIVLTMWAMDRSRYPFLIAGDGIAYYAWLPSVLLDNDVELDNQLTFAHEAGYIMGGQWPISRTKTGLAVNLFEIGPALLWMPSYVGAMLFYRVAPGLSTSGANVGFGVFPFEFSIVAATFIYGWLGLWLSYRSVRLYDISASAALFGVVFIWAGTSALYYHLFHGFVAHGVSFFSVALFFYAYSSLVSRKSRSKWIWCLLGIAAGLVIVTYTSQIAFVIPVLIVLFVLQLHEEETDFLSLLSHWSIVAFSMFVVLLPQLVSWNLLFGSPAPPPRARGYLLTAPFILQTLISTRHGLITWAPITILSFVGLLLLVVRRFKAGFPLLIGVVGLVYINGIAIDWWGGDAFGARRYVGLTSLLAFALAYLFSLPKTKVLQALMVAISLLCVSWTMLFLVQYSAGLIPPDDYLSSDQLINQKLFLLQRVSYTVFEYIRAISKT